MKKITVCQEDLKELLKTVKETIATDDSRPILRWIKMEVNKDTLTAVSLDGYMMSTVQIPLKNNDEEKPFSFFIQPFHIPTSKSGSQITFDATNKEYVTVTIEPLLSKDTVSYKIYQPKNEYIAWEKVIPDTDKTLKVSVDAGRLIRLLRGYRSNLVDNNMVTITFVRNKIGFGIDPLKPVVFEQKTVTDLKKQSILLPVRNLRD